MSEKEQFLRRYREAMHAVQSAIKWKIMLENPGFDELEVKILKHLRVGVDSAHVSIQAHAEIMIRKGIMTELEYFEQIAISAEKEQASHEAELGRKFS